MGFRLVIKVELYKKQEAAEKDRLQSMFIPLTKEFAHEDNAYKFIADLLTMLTALHALFK